MKDTTTTVAPDGIEQKSGNQTVPFPNETRSFAALRKRSRTLFSPGSPNPVWDAVWDYLQIVLGCFIIAASFNLLLNGNRLVNGGLTGISTLLQSSLHIEPAVTQIVVNAVLFLLGTALLGRRFGAKTLVGILLLPAFVFLTRHLTPLTNNLLLAALYGGIGTGVGLGLLFRGGGSVGGTSLAAQIMARYLGMSIGTALLLCDGLIIGIASLTFGPEPAMYGLISLFVVKRAVDVVQSGLSASKLALIICKEADGVEAIRRAVIEDIDRGLTILNGTGGFTGQDRPVLMVVVSQSEVSRLKALVHAADPSAFLVLTDAAEVLGEGFKRYRM
jgi:uncharacterized membrane-anchored protein YitT (DUF2179 family)